MKFKKNGEWKDIGFKVADTLPVGSEVDFNGSEVPSGWEEAIESYAQAKTMEGDNLSFDDVGEGGKLQRSGLYTMFIGTTWWHLINIRHRNGYDDGNNWGMQIRKNMTNANAPIEFRTQQNGAWGAWEQVNKEPTGDVLWINPNSKDALVSSSINANFSGYSKFRVFIYVDTNCTTLIQWDINSDYIGKDVTLTYTSNYSRIIKISSNQLRIHSGYYAGSQNDGALILSHIIGYK